MTVQRFKRLLAIFVLVLAVIAVIRPVGLQAGDIKENEATYYGAMVLDDAELFTKYEEAALLEKAYDLTEYADVFVVTVAKGQNPYGSSESSTKKYGDAIYLDYSNNNSCIMFIIDMHTRYIYVYRYGKAEKSLTTGKCESITDNVYDYASDGDYYKCASFGLEQIGKVLNGEKIAEPMKVASNFFIAFVIGFVVMYLVALGKSKVSTTSDSEMLKYAAISFAANNTKDVVTGTTKTYCPRSSGSSGGRSGGGGGFHGGGGGGHRF